MKIKAQLVAVLVMISLLAGAGGTYVGMTFLDDSLEAADSGLGQQNADFTKLKKAFHIISDRNIEDVSDSEILEGAIQGMIGTLDDPYSVYMDEETVQQFTESLESSFEGIGAEVSMQNGKVTIVAPFKDSPAEEAGLKPNDKIITIDGNNVEGLDLYDAVLQIRGERGSLVTLGIERAGVSELLEIEVKRDEIPIETVYSHEYERNGKTIGVLEITSFSEETAKDFEKQLRAFEKEDIDGLVIDVRDNPGGYLNSVEEMAQLIIPNDKPYIQIEDQDGNREQIRSSLEEKKDYPIVALINAGSASASEIIAAALKEGAGYDVVGEQSFGKGTVQQAVDLGDGSNLKLTMFKWLTPDGHWIHEKGVEPTVTTRQPDYFYTSPFTIEEEPLRYDMNSSQVKSAQKMLEGLGFAPGRTDGYFGKKTEQSVRAFQENNDLNVTGEIDAKTAEKLQDEIIQEVRDPENDLQLQTALELLSS